MSRSSLGLLKIFPDERLSYLVPRTPIDSLERSSDQPLQYQVSGVIRKDTPVRGPSTLPLLSIIPIYSGTGKGPPRRCGTNLSTGTRSRDRGNRLGVEGLPRVQPLATECSRFFRSSFRYVEVGGWRVVVCICVCVHSYTCVRLCVYVSVCVLCV